jgi:hypothetical protein
MAFLNHAQFPLRVKKITVETQQLEGIWYVNWQLGKNWIYSTFYTCIDRVCIVWSVMLIAMFSTAQFLPINWILLAKLWSILSCIGIATMIILANEWAKKRQATWLLYCWTIFILTGVVATDLALFLGWGGILTNLCTLWLGLSTMGYLCTAIAMRSLAFIVVAIVHILFIFILPYVIAWQFMLTGTFMALSLLVLAEFQWDGL